MYAGDFAKLPNADIDATVDALTEDVELRYDWSFWARPEQRLPDGDWINWVILAGRGMGKTRIGSETVRQWVKSYRYVNLIGATADDVRTIVRLLEISLRVLYDADYRRESISKIRVLLEKCQKLLVAEFRRRHLLSLHRFVESTAYCASL